MEIVKLEDFDNIWHIKGFDKAFLDLFGKSKRQCEVCLDTLFRDLELLNHHEMRDLAQFEALTAEDDLYAIRLMGKTNCRVLYTVLTDGKIVLLCPFFEKSTSDYERAIRKVKPIVKELFGR